MHCRSSSTLHSSVHWGAQKSGEVRDLRIVIALRLSIDVWLFGTAHVGLAGSASILDRWKNEDGTHKFAKFSPEEKSKSYPCRSEADGRAVSKLVSNMLRLDGRHPYKGGT